MKLPTRFQPVALWLRTHVTERVAFTACMVVMSVLAWAVMSLSPAACVIATFLGFVCIVAADFIESELDAQLDITQNHNPPRDAAKD